MNLEVAGKGIPMWFYRIAAVLLVLFAVGHQLGFQSVDPKWHADAAVGAMKSVRFDILGMNRSYWEFFSGFGYFVTVFLLFCAVLAWILGGIKAGTIPNLTVLRWAFAAAFAAIAFLSWRFFFIVPLGFSAVIAVCLGIAAAF